MMKQDCLSCQDDENTLVTADFKPQASTVARSAPRQFGKPFLKICNDSACSRFNVSVIHFFHAYT